MRAALSSVGPIAFITSQLLIASCGRVADDEPPPTYFCASRPELQFCEDFDEAPLPGRFDSQSNFSVQLDRATQTSFPAALRILSPGGSLKKTFPPGRRFTATAMIRIGRTSNAFDGNSEGLDVGFDFELPNGAFGLGVDFAANREVMVWLRSARWENTYDDAGQLIAASGTSSMFPFLVGRHGIEPAVWTPVSVRVVLAESGVDLAIEAGGVTVFDGRVGGPAGPLSPDFSLGGYGNSDFMTHVDDVTFTVE